MKKTALLILFTAGIAASCKSPVARQSPAANKEKRTCKYICIMDKDVCADKPGVCPKCGMELVEKDADR